MPNANEWLEQNYPQNSVCLIDDWYKNKGKKRSEITHLAVHQQNLTGTLDLSTFSNLAWLYCYNNQLTELILPANSSLKRIDCSENQLTNLDLSSCLKLEVLICASNQLSSLELNNCLNLKELTCWNNQLTSLNLPNDNQLIKIYASDNYLTTFNYGCLNPLTLKDLRIDNNNLEAIDLQVFASFINLTYLTIGNSDSWINKWNLGNQFTGSLVSFQDLTKLETLDVQNLSLQPTLEYLSSSLQVIICNGWIRKELMLYGKNLIAWQSHHPHLMKQANKAIIHLTDYQLVTKKQISADYSSWFEGREIKRKSFSYQSQFAYSLFLVKDIHPFNWENESIVSSEFIPLRLYNLSTDKVETTTNQVINSKNERNINNYLILSYCWGTDWEKTPQTYGQTYHTDLTRLGRKALNKVKATYQFLKKENANLPDHIWIDNFCINQSDNLEKGQEVRKQRNYYSNATATLIAIDSEIGEIDKSNRDKFMGHLVQKIFHSDWFTRAWTFQEGLLSKQTIFMFDNYLVDGRSLALYWGGGGAGAYNSKPCTFITPFGWSAVNQISSLSLEKTEKNISLNLGEALFAVTHRNQTVLLDKLYSILGLLPYGDQIKIDYAENNLENKLAELIQQVYLYNPKEIISYLGERNSSNWWLPVINSNGSFQIEDALNYDERAEQHYLTQIEQVTQQGIQLKGHWISQGANQIIELDRADWKNNIRWPVTLQFILNQKAHIIIIKQVRKFYYSETQQPTELFIDMINFQVIEGKTQIKEYLQELETNSQRSVQSIEQHSVQFSELEQNKSLDESLIAQVEDLEISNYL